MSFNLSIKRRAQKQLLKIAKSDPKQYKKIKISILKLEENLFSSPLWIKKLHGKNREFFCIKVNNYRIKFEYNGNAITILKISLRKDAYK